MMGGPWRERNDKVHELPGRVVRVQEPRRVWVEPESPAWAGVERLHVYAACLVLGAILGAAALILVSPWLPFVVLR